MTSAEAALFHKMATADVGMLNLRDRISRQIDQISTNNVPPSSSRNQSRSSRFRLESIFFWRERSLMSRARGEVSRLLENEDEKIKNGFENAVHDVEGFFDRNSSPFILYNSTTLTRGMLTRKM